MPTFFNQVQLDFNAISNGTTPLAQVDYIKGSFKVMTLVEASSLSSFEQWAPAQIVYFTDSSSLWQYNYVPFNPDAGAGKRGGGGMGCSFGWGGSSYTDPTLCSSIVHTQGVQIGHGQLIIIVP
jgi:hypothetical protein